MEKQNKNLLLTFIELATEQGILKDGITEHKKKIFNLMNEVEENYTGEKKVFVQLERAIIDVIELTQHKYFEYGKNDQRVHVREEYKRNSEGLKILESYYSYPDYTYENEKPYLQISIYENNPHGLLKLVHTENPDGTYFHEYYVDTTKRSTLFTKYVSKYSKERKELYSEQYYEKQLYKGKVYRVIEYRDETESVTNILYYDKDGNEIPKSELGISE